MPDAEMSPADRSPVIEAPPEWSRPSEVFDTGSCSGCGRPVEPSVVKINVVTPAYEGDLVVVSYQAQGVQKLMINGRVFSWDEVDGAREYANELLGSEHADGIMQEALVLLTGCGGVH